MPYVKFTSSGSLGAFNQLMNVKYTLPKKNRRASDNVRQLLKTGTLLYTVQEDDPVLGIIVHVKDEDIREQGLGSDVLTALELADLESRRNVNPTI